MAGLSAALCLAEQGRAVQLWEAAGHAGGRVRSFHDAVLDRVIDNGSHLILTGNGAVARFRARARAAEDALVAAPQASFPMVDLAASGPARRFTLALNRGPLPWWIASPARRVPGTGVRDYLRGWRLAVAPAHATVADAVRDRGPLWRAFWEPMTLGVLNTTPERGQARLLWRVLAETFARGAGPSRPMFAPGGLDGALVAPAVAQLHALGVPVGFNRMLKAIQRDRGRAQALVVGEERLALGDGDSVILALPPARLRKLMPELDPPGDEGAILNAHFRVADPAAIAHVAPLTGVIGALAQWVFRRGDVLSVTVSAADRLGILATPREEVQSQIWREVRAALGLPDDLGVVGRVIVEKRATFDQSPAGVAQRLGPRTALANVILAGDATDTGLPATIEGALRSGETAAGLVAEGRIPGVGSRIGALSTDGTG